MRNLIFVLLTIVFLSCEDDEPSRDGNCGPEVILTEQERNSDPFFINSASISGDCLAIEISAGGCDGESWSAELIADPAVAESYPPQMWIEMIFDDDELCEAAITKIFTFDLSPLRPISDRITLHLEGWEESIEYN